MVALHTREYQLEARSFIDNPPHEDLRKMVAEMPNAKPTVYGNLDVFTRVDARSTASTYIVTDDPEAWPELAPIRKHITKVGKESDDYPRGSSPFDEPALAIVELWQQEIGPDPHLDSCSERVPKAAALRLFRV